MVTQEFDAVVVGDGQQNSLHGAAQAHPPAGSILEFWPAAAGDCGHSGQIDADSH